MLLAANGWPALNITEWLTSDNFDINPRSRDNRQLAGDTANL